MVAYATDAQSRLWPNGPPTILVVDDDRMSRRLAAAALQPLGCPVIFAENAAEGLVLARQRRPAVIVLDLQMPGLNGADFLAFVESSADRLDARIVVWTGQELTPEQTQALSSIAHAVVHKGEGGLERLLEKLWGFFVTAASRTQIEA